MDVDLRFGRALGHDLCAWCRFDNDTSVQSHVVGSRSVGLILNHNLEACIINNVFGDVFGRCVLCLDDHTRVGIDANVCQALGADACQALGAYTHQTGAHWSSRQNNF